MRAGRRLVLNTRVVAVVECLAGAEGKPVSAEELVERVWDEAATSQLSYDVHHIGHFRAVPADIT